MSSTPEFTIVSVPAFFWGPRKSLQERALSSWLELTPRPEVILLGEETGVADAAKEFGVRHIPKVGCNKFETPVVRNVIEQAVAEATCDSIVFVSADTLLSPDLPECLRQVSREHSRFLMVSSRLETNGRTTALIKPEPGVTPHDYIAFSRTSFDYIPKFAVGRGSWQGWVLGDAVFRQVPVILADDPHLAVHQKHSSEHTLWRLPNLLFESPEYIENQQIAGLSAELTGAELATWSFKAGKLIEITQAIAQETLNQIADDAKRIRIVRGQALVEQGMQFLEWGKGEKGLACFKELYDISPEYPGLDMFFGIAYYNLYRWEEAKKACQKASLNPEYKTQADHMLGLIDEQIEFGGLKPQPAQKSGPSNPS